MPTDNPKVSGYVPQHIYDRFKDFQEKQEKLSMSQTLTVILAEYFGLKDTIREITEGTIIGGVTLAEFEQLKKRVSELETIASIGNVKKVISEETTSKLKSKAVSLADENLQLEIISEGDSIELKTAVLAKRFGLKTNSVASAKNRRKTIESFCEWSRTKDPDGIGWIPNSKTKLIPAEKLSGELLSRLQDWISNNTL